MLARLALARLPSQPLLHPLPLNMCCRVRPLQLVLLLVPSMGPRTSQLTGAASHSCERASPPVLARCGRRCLSFLARHCAASAEPAVPQAARQWQALGVSAGLPVAHVSSRIACLSAMSSS